MAAGLHGSARTTPRVRAELQAAQDSTRALAPRYRLNPKTVAKWRSRTGIADAPMGPRQPRSTVLTEAKRRSLPSSAGAPCCRSMMSWVACGKPSQSSPAARSIAAWCGTASHACRRTTRLPPSANASPRPGSVTSTSMSASCAWPKASCSCSSPSTACPSSLTSPSAMPTPR